MALRVAPSPDAKRQVRAGNLFHYTVSHGDEDNGRQMDSLNQFFSVFKGLHKHSFNQQ